MRRATGERDQVGISRKCCARQRAEPQSSQVSRSIRAVLFPLGGDLRHIGLAGQQRAERLLHVLVQRIETPIRVCQRAQRRAAGELEQRRLDRVPALLAQPRDRLARATAAQSSTFWQRLRTVGSSIDGRDVISSSRLRGDGSSSVFSTLFAALGVIRCAGSTIATL